ncbi:DUF1178 family protein [Methylovirgula sp. 4M-Z18]|uniref:DUF1178 family protein n=1 Tax=Methylovirgula sp. 4M-Z18 TaxID=2293567 RepID=UPI000E2F56C0|nr:DUF1178 family protein [Methylovirgula sp. 4M-Z18]RFB81309.1 DUF1178 family protein [Methylovirgula sp. 4M-Z18]
MIKYSLICDKAHEFESWFASSEAFDKQVKRGLVTCPQCNSAKVAKAIMAPRIARTDNVTRQATPEAPQEGAKPVALLDEKSVAMRAAMRELRQKIIENTDDVGKSFADEARKMHEGELPQRSIRGETTFDEARALIEDGIDVLPLPGLADERN